MVQNKKTPTTQEESEAAATMLEDALSSMTDKQVKFWQAMNSGDFSQLQAYELAYETSNMSKAAISVEASRLWNSPKFTLARSAFTKTVVRQEKRSLQERIARMESLREVAIESGNIGAAFQCEQALGKLEGHYVEKSENITRHIDYAETVKALESVLPAEAIEEIKSKLGLTIHKGKIHAEEIH